MSTKHLSKQDGEDKRKLLKVQAHVESTLRLLRESGIELVIDDHEGYVTVGPGHRELALTCGRMSIRINA